MAVMLGDVFFALVPWESSVFGTPRVALNCLVLVWFGWGFCVC